MQLSGKMCPHCLPSQSLITLPTRPDLYRELQRPVLVPLNAALSCHCLKCTDEHSSLVVVLLWQHDWKNVHGLGKCRNITMFQVNHSWIMVLMERYYISLEGGFSVNRDLSKVII